MKPGTLILLPNLLGDAADPRLMPACLDEVAQQLDGFFVETDRGGRRACRRMLGPNFTTPYLPIHQERLTPERCDELLAPLLAGQRWGLLSDAGMPCLADPGHLLVQRAHHHQLPVTALPGPSSILLGLALSGLPCQRFAFHGYLPRDRAQRQQLLQKLELRSRAEEATQCWIETPYRTQQLLDELIQLLQPSTWLAIAADLTLPTQQIMSQQVRHWRQAYLVRPGGAMSRRRGRGPRVTHVGLAHNGSEAGRGELGPLRGAHGETPMSELGPDEARLASPAAVDCLRGSRPRLDSPCSLSDEERLQDRPSGTADRASNGLTRYRQATTNVWNDRPALFLLNGLP